MRTKSEINYDYQTIEISQSRVNKGLIALPRSLVGWFPDYNTTIRVYLGDSLSLTDRWVRVDLQGFLISNLSC